MFTRAILLILLASLALASGRPDTARAKVMWLCNPSLAASSDPCEAPLDTTRITAQGTSTSTPERPVSQRRPIDCFYVYPTVTDQASTNATQTADPVVDAIAKFQATPFSTGCRMFAPLYRQVTNTALPGIFLKPTLQIAYDDVVEAWKDYLANDNHGRGVLILGHSQGTILLRQLIRQQIDPDPAARDRLVGAVMLGGNVTVKSGQTTGGDFQHVALCTTPGQDGCVIAYSTASTDPEPAAVFGNTNTDLTGAAFGYPHGAGYDVACTDPGPLSGQTGPFSLKQPSAPYPAGFIHNGLLIAEHGSVPSPSTAYVDAFQYTGGCARINGANVLRYQPLGDSPQLGEFPPTGGTHLVDYNVGLDRLTSIAALQSHTWLAAHLLVGRPRVNRRTNIARITVTVPGAGTIGLVGRRAIARRRTVVAEPGRIVLKATPTRRTRRTVSRGRTAHVTATITYQPATGPAISTRVKLTFRRR